MKTTPFTHIHERLGAKMHEFAGYNMPIEYPTGIIAEHLAVVNSVGLFDVSHMGEIWIKGDKALKFIQEVTSNDASKLQVGDIQYSCLPNDKAGIVDDLLVYRYEDDKYMFVVNASNIEKDWQWCNKMNKVGAELENSSDNIAQLALQGPKALDTLQKLTDIDLKSIPYYKFKVGQLAGCDNIIISNTGYTGASGFELYFYPNEAETIWSAIMEAGKEFGIIPVGLGARDTLRLEMGYCLYGNDITDETSPIEASLGWITKFTDDKDFPSKSVLAQQKAEGPTRKLIAFRMKDKGIPRNGYSIVDEDSNPIGVVTSGSISPTLGEGIGMGYVKSEFAKLSTPIYIQIRNRKLEAEVVKPPMRKG